MACRVRSTSVRDAMSGTGTDQLAPDASAMFWNSVQVEVSSASKRGRTEYRADGCVKSK